MDVEVYWLGRRVGLLREITVDQPYLLGAWLPADNPAFTAALATGDGVPVVLQSPDSADVSLVYALVGPTPEARVYFRWGPWSLIRRQQSRTGQGVVERHEVHSPPQRGSRDLKSRLAADPAIGRPKSKVWMTHAEWLCSDDLRMMLAALWDAIGDEASWVSQVRRYLMARCRRIERLLPQEASRRGLDVAEQYLTGAASDDELKEAIHHAEGAAFNLYHNCDPEAIEQWADEVRAIPAGEMAALLDPPGVAWEMDALELLKLATGFAFFVTVSPGGLWGVPGIYFPFLSVESLREHFGSPFQEQGRCVSPHGRSRLVALWVQIGLFIVAAIVLGILLIAMLGQP
jgi:hypothetical protein